MYICLESKNKKIKLLSGTIIPFFMNGQKDQASGNKYILAVDDDLDIVALIEQTLRKHRFKISTFTDPSMALEYLKENCKDCGLILSDIRMPGINGYEFVTQVKKINPEVKIILMSAFEIQDKEFHNILPDIKIDGFLRKPFHIQQLNEVIAEISTRN
jgi:two-component SAPR family response regulator